MSGLKIYKFVHGPAQTHGPAGQTRASRGPAHVLCCIFDSFKVKTKGKECSTGGPAHAGSCGCGWEIKFLDRDRPAAHVADNGPGLERARAVPDPNRAGPARHMPTSTPNIMLGCFP